MQPSGSAHTRLFEHLTDYYFTGGMPEAVRTWFDMASTSIAECTLMCAL